MEKLVDMISKVGKDQKYQYYHFKEPTWKLKNGEDTIPKQVYETCESKRIFWKKRLSSKPLEVCLEILHWKFFPRGFYRYCKDDL